MKVPARPELPIVLAESLYQTLVAGGNDFEAVQRYAASCGREAGSSNRLAAEDDAQGTRLAVSGIHQWCMSATADQERDGEDVPKR